MTAMNTTNDIDCTSVRDLFFSSKPCLYRHVELLMRQRGPYLDALNTVCQKHITETLSQPTKAMIVAALHMTGNQKHINDFLKHCDVVAIVKACQILDRPRLIKQLEQKIAKIEQEHPHLIAEEHNSEESAKEGTKRKTRYTKEKVEADKNETEPIPKKRKRRIDVYRNSLKTSQSLLLGTHGSNDLNCKNAHRDRAVQEIIASASLSGAFAQKVRRWAKELKEDFLEFIVMSGSMSLWKDLADLVHFSPNDFELPYFLSAVHGGGLPEDSFVFGMRTLLDASEGDATALFCDLAQKYPQVYQAFNFLRTQDHLLRNKEIACMLAANIPLSTAIWYLEELARDSASLQVSEIVGSRLEKEDWMDESSKVTKSFGKLLERILTFRLRKWNKVANCLLPAATRCLGALKKKWSISEEKRQQEGLTVIFGDKSASMTSAIQAATILAAMVSTCFQGELSFFDHSSVESPHKRPSSVDHVLEIVRTIRADNCTSMAAALWPYYEKKIKIARIVLVSDEGENTSKGGYRFAALLKKYKKEVHSGVELVSICVDSGNASFRNSLSQESITYKRIEIDGHRPDLSKFDSLLGQIALLSEDASEQ